MAGVQVSGRDVVGATPPATLVPFTLWVNPKDRKIWTTDSSGAPVLLTTIRLFSSTARFAPNDYVLYSGQLYICTSLSDAVAFDPAKFTQLTGAAASLIAPAANAFVVGPADISGLIGAIANACVRIFGTSGASQSVLHLGARALTQVFLAITNSAQKRLFMIRELATSKALSIELRDEEETIKHYIQSVSTDPFVVLGGNAEARFPSVLLSVKGNTKVQGDFEVTGNITGPASAGLFTNPVKLGPDATPVFLWGDTAGRLRWKSNSVPTSATDGTLI